jgi:hypothetical protein
MTLNCFVSVLLLGLSNAQTTDPTVWATTVSGTLVSQKPDMASLQSKIDSLDAKELGPAVSRNTNILQQLRTAATIIDGTSVIHKNVSAQTAQMASIKATINGTQIPTMKQGLVDVRTTLLSQQESLRTMMQQAIADKWTSLDINQFIPFTDLIRNQTIAVIRNISQPINDMDNFINQTIPSLANLINNADIAMNGTASQFMHDLQIAANEIQYVKEQLPRLTDVLEPRWENETRTQVLASIEDIYATMAGASQAVADDAQYQMDAQLNSSKQLLYTILNNTRASILNNLREPGDYLAEFTALQSMAATNAEFVKNIGSMTSMIKDKLQVFKDRKAFMLQNILPLVAGLGNRTADIRNQYLTIVSQMEGQFNQSRDTQFVRLDNYSQVLQNMYANRLNGTYTDALNQISQRMQTVPTFMNGRLLVANQTLKDLLDRAGPRIDDMQASMAAVKAQAAVALNLTRAAINKLKNSTFNDISRKFNDSSNDMVARINGLETQVNASKRNFNSTIYGLAQAFASQEKTSANDTDTRMQALAEALTSNYQKFNSSYVPIPDVTNSTNLINSESARNATLAALDSNLSSFGAQMVAFQQKYTANMSNVTQAFNAFQESQFATSLRATLNQMLADKKSEAMRNLSFVVGNYSQASDSINAQLVAARQIIENNTNAFRTSVQQRAWSPNVSMDQIDNVVAAIQDAATRSRMSVSGTADSLQSDFARNVSADDAETDRQIGNMLKASQSVWLNNITALLDPGNALGQISTVLNNVQSQLSSYSDDGSQYRLKARESKDGIESLDDSLKRAQNSLDSSYANLDRDGSTAVSQIGLELAKLNVTAPQLIGTYLQKIAKLATDTNPQIDAKVNQTKMDISNRLRGIFFNTENAVQDYVDYVNGSVTSVQSTATAASQQVALSAMQLHNVSARTRMAYKDGLEAAKTSHLKNVKIHEVLKKEADRILQAVQSENRNTGEFEERIHMKSLDSQNELLRNLTSFASWFSSRVKAINSSLIDDELMANHTLELRGRAAGLNITAARKRAQKELGQVIEALNKTELFEVINDMTRIQATLDSRNKQAHQVLGTVATAINRTSGSIPNPAVLYRALLERLSGMMNNLARDLPQALQLEVEAEKTGIEDRGHKISELVEKHEFKVPDFKREFDKLFDVPMIADIIDETRRNLYRQAHEASEPKDFNSELKDLEEQLGDLQKNHQAFIRDQRRRARQRKGRGKGA